MGGATEGADNFDAGAVMVGAPACTTVVVVVVVVVGDATRVDEGEMEVVVDVVVAGGTSVVVVGAGEVTGDAVVAVACAAALAGPTPATTNPITTSSMASCTIPVRWVVRRSRFMANLCQQRAPVHRARSRASGEPSWPAAPNLAMARPTFAAARNIRRRLVGWDADVLTATAV